MRIGSLLNFVTSPGSGGGSTGPPGTSPLASRSALARSGVRVVLRRVVELGLRRLIHQIDALFLQGNQQIVELVGIDFLVGQIVVDLVIGEITLRLPPGDQFLQILVEKVHRTYSFRASIARWVIKESPVHGILARPWVWKCRAGHTQRGVVALVVAVAGILTRPWARKCRASVWFAFGG